MATATATAPTDVARPTEPLAAQQPVRVPRSAHTLTGFRAWSHSDTFPTYGRITFLAGEVIVDMSGDELTSHAWLKTEVNRVLANLNVERQLGIMSNEGTQVVNKAADVSNIPDAVFVTWDSLNNGRARFVPRERRPGQLVELEGAPDLVVEVVSDSSVLKDTVDLRHAYYQAGIPEYWLIDARGDDIDFQILLARRGGYAASPVRGGWRRSRVFDRHFRLERTRGPMDLWQYRLHMR
jgi:Uma2 family endonuclease